MSNTPTNIAFHYPRGPIDLVLVNKLLLQGRPPAYMSCIKLRSSPPSPATPAPYDLTNPCSKLRWHVTVLEKETKFYEDKMGDKVEYWQSKFEHAAELHDLAHRIVTTPKKRRHVARKSQMSMESLELPMQTAITPGLQSAQWETKINTSRDHSQVLPAGKTMEAGLLCSHSPDEPDYVPGQIDSKMEKSRGRKRVHIELPNHDDNCHNVERMSKKPRKTLNQSPQLYSVTTDTGTNGGANGCRRAKKKSKRDILNTSAAAEGRYLFRPLKSVNAPSIHCI